MKPVALLALIAAISASQPGAAGWPQYLGARHDGTSSDLMLPPKPALAVAWRRPVGAALAGVTIAGDRAYTLETDGEDDVLVALDAASGKDLWRAKLGKTHADALTNGPGSTPAVSGPFIVVMGSSCTLSAFATRDGALVWSIDFAQVYKTRFAARNGCSNSPLVHEELVVIPTGSMQTDRLVALDLATGKQRWSAAGLEASPNSNISMRMAAGGPQLLYHYFKAGTSGLAAVTLSNGTKVWAVDLESGLSNTAPVPVGEARVLLQTWQGSAVFDASGSPAPRRLWRNDAIVALSMPAVGVEGHVFGFGGNSGEYLTCVDAATGVTKWTERTYRGAISAAGRTLVMQAEGSGLLRLIDADPTAYRELARLETLKPGARTLAAPSIAHGRIYIRNLEEVVAVSVR